MFRGKDCITTRGKGVNFSETKLNIVKCIGKKTNRVDTGIVVNSSIEFDIDTIVTFVNIIFLQKSV